MRKREHYRTSVDYAIKDSILGIIAFLLIGIFMFWFCNREEQIPRSTKIERQFSVFDGSHVAVTDSLKRIFGDVKPGKVTYMDQDKTIFVTEEFTSQGKQYKAFADVTIDGAIINLSFNDL